MLRRGIFLTLVLCLSAWLPLAAFAQAGTGCCRPSTGGSCIDGVTTSTCPSPSTYYPGQLCSTIAACSSTTTPATTGCCVANTGGTCTDNQTASTCPSPNVLHLGQACSSIASCPKPATTTSGSPSTTSKSPAIIFSPEITIPTFSGNGEITVDGQTIAKYIKAVFVYFIWAVGILAVVMITYGGIRWVAAAGNAGRINDARETVNNALIGLIIALTSVVLLNIINPGLTSFKGITPVVVTTEILKLDTTPGEHNEAGTCKTKSGRPVEQESSCQIGREHFTWPVSGAAQTVTSRMGPRSPEVGSTCHPGTDFSTDGKTGKTVVAMFDGKISSITSGCNENIVKLTSTKQLEEFYARYVHVHTVSVTVGQIVKAGDPIGTSGGDPTVASGCSTGPHLHVEVYDVLGILHDVYPCVYK